MKFYIDYNNFNDCGIPIYRKFEQSFDFEPYINSNFSLMLGSSCTGLEINLESKKVCYLSGFNPMNTWEKSKITLPEFKKGTLFIKKSTEYLPGTGIETHYQFKTVYDKKSGWIYFYSEHKSEFDNCVMITSDTIIALDNNTIISIWIKPKFI